MTVLGFAPFYIFFIPIISLAVLYHFWSSAGTKQAAATGFFFGLGFFLSGVSWVYISLHDFGGMPLPAAIAATFMFCAFISLFPALVGFCQSFFPGRLKYVLVIPALWVVSEWTRGWIFTGFPWLSLGYSQVPFPLSGFAPVLGVYGVSLLTALSAGLVFSALKKDWRIRSLLALILIWIPAFYLQGIQWTSPEGKPLSVSLLQGNIPQDRKWDKENMGSTLDNYLGLVLKSRSRLVILPETAIPLFYDEIPISYLKLLSDHGKRNDGDVLIGLPEMENEEYYNSVFNFGVSPLSAYRKSHLVPFGEFLPVRPLFGWILGILHIPLSDFSRGSPDQQPMNAAGQRLAIDICYEDVFGEEVIRQLPNATMLVNVSNDAWFGNLLAPKQHMQISQMRAIETGRMMLRATNTGMTAIIDNKGRVVSTLPPVTRGSLDGMAQGYAGTTPYVRFGNRMILFLCALMLFAGFWDGLRFKRQSD